LIRNSHFMARCLLLLLGVSSFIVLCPRAFAGTYYIASYGSDSNAGTSKTAAWLHAPGMPNCTANCAAHKPAAGDKFIFRGGDVWHFGNSSVSPFTGGQWNLPLIIPYNDTNDKNCQFEGVQTGCVYIGVDSTWYTGNGWSRPILDGDNPLSKSLVSSCTFQTGPASSGFTNSMVVLAADVIFDNFEMRGLCAETPSPKVSQNNYLAYNGTGHLGTGMVFETNVYIHGWTASTTAGLSTSTIPCVALGGSNNGLQTIDHVVVDGSDSVAGACAAGSFPSFYHMRYSLFRYTTQLIGQWCHDIHDNVFEYYDAPIHPTHGNLFKCNNDSTGNAHNQPQNTPNVFYNNIARHASTAFSVAGNVKLWFCPTGIPEYWFNNVEYDLGGPANFWAIAGPPGYTCTNAGGQFMFNNTLVDGQQPCHLTGTNQTGGKYLSVFNEHLINTPWDGLGCQGRQSATNILMSTSAAASQGYVTTSGRINTQLQGSVSCANENSKACAPTKASAATVGMGINRESYCTALAGYKSETAISVDAANACRNGFTAPCSYNNTTHAMSCNNSAQAPRPASAAWDASAYQFLLTSTPAAPVVTSVTVQ
jgi:hypothetical protein